MYNGIFAPQRQLRYQGYQGFEGWVNLIVWSSHYHRNGKYETPQQE